MTRFNPSTNFFDRAFPNSDGASSRRAKDEADTKRSENMRASFDNPRKTNSDQSSDYADNRMRRWYD